LSGASSSLLIWHHFGVKFVDLAHNPFILRLMEKTKNETQAQPVSFKNFRLFLQSELVRRCKNNPNYSLRSFARSLNISHGALSRILRGERNPSKKLLISLAQALNLSSAQIEEFGKELNRNSKKTLKSGFTDLSMDSFTMMSEWYHDAILELMRIEGFKVDPKWIAKRLGITMNEVNIAVERLARLELIEITEDGSWISHAEHTEIGIESPYTTTALKRYQKQILQMGADAVDQVSREKRHNISSTVAIASSDLDEVKKLINDFRRKLSKYVQRKGVQANQVYQLGICFYPLTDRKENEV
jgi:uncharacterized protein (TIGR02147 family)